MTHGCPPAGDYFPDENLYRLDELTGSFAEATGSLNSISGSLGPGSAISGSALMNLRLQPTQVSLLEDILCELKIMNAHFSLINDQNIEKEDIDI